MTSPVSSRLPVVPPIPNADDAPFWEAAAEGRLMLPRCGACATVIWYPRPFCPACGSTSVGWFEASGRGSVYSFTVNHRGAGPWAAASPFVIAYVELEEGPRVLTNIVDCDPDAVVMGMPVEAIFDGEGADVALRFRPA